MKDEIINALLLSKVCDEASERIGRSIRGDKRDRILVYYRSAITVLFRDEHNMTYDSIGSEMGKNHATIINSYKKGIEYTELKYSDFLEIVNDVKLITSYCEVNMGVPSEPIGSIVDQMYDMVQEKVSQSDISKTGAKVIIYNLIRKIKENIL
jgi:predicted transcriptional regulator